MIDVICYTNLDLHHAEKWPMVLPALPRVGDEIQSAMDWKPFRLSLQVVAVRFKATTVFVNGFQKTEWIPHIELHMARFQQELPCSLGEQYRGSIRAFYEWYATLIGSRVGAFI